MEADFDELQRQSQENLITFLRTDAKLASTFCKIAESTQDPDHRARLMKGVRTVVNAIRHFGERITDPTTRAELNAEADRLEGFLAN